MFENFRIDILFYKIFAKKTNNSACNATHSAVVVKPLKLFVLLLMVVAVYLAVVAKGLIPVAKHLAVVTAQKAHIAAHLAPVAPHRVVVAIHLAVDVKGRD